MTVADLATRVGVSPDTVRHYVRIGLLKPYRHPDNGYKLFKDSDIMRLRFIRQAKNLGYTLAEIGQILQDSEQGHSPCKRMREIIHHRIAMNKKHLEELNALQRRMEEALEQWETIPDGILDVESICQLIESAGD